MKKYKNVKAVKARKCISYANFESGSYCIGVSEMQKNPTCKGYKCKCTEYKYDKKKGEFTC